MVWFGIERDGPGGAHRGGLTSFPMYVTAAGGVRNTDRKLVEATLLSFGMGRLAPGPRSGAPRRAALASAVGPRLSDDAERHRAHRRGGDQLDRLASAT